LNFIVPNDAGDPRCVCSASERNPVGKLHAPAFYRLLPPERQTSLHPSNNAPAVVQGRDRGAYSRRSSTMAWASRLSHLPRADKGDRWRFLKPFTDDGKGMLIDYPRLFACYLRFYREGRA
jgi:hypothetical protein